MSFHSMLTSLSELIAVLTPASQVVLGLELVPRLIQRGKNRSSDHLLLSRSILREL